MLSLNERCFAANTWLHAPLFFVLALILSQAPQLNAQSQNKGPKNPLSSARILSAELDKLDPLNSTSDWAQRRLIASYLDGIFNVPVAAEDHPLLKQSSGQFIAAFYRARLTKTLHDLATMPAPITGFRIHKLYSSSYLLRSAQKTVAFDFSPGPFIWYGLDGISTLQVQQIAKEVDAYFVTHVHPDHFSIFMMAEMIAQGKPVVATQAVRDFLLGNGYAWGSQVTIPKGIAGLSSAKGVAFYHYRGAQYTAFINNNLKQPDLTAPAVENNCYMVKIGGRWVLHMGDNNDRHALSWLLFLRWRGVQTDTLLQATFMRPHVIASAKPKMAFRGHEWEFTHSGAAFGNLKIEPVYDAMNRSLIWGETALVP